MQYNKMNNHTRSHMGMLIVNNEKFLLYEGVNTIGRSKEAIANIKHMNISQNHAIIVIIDGRHYISDLKSSNGSFCYESKLEPFKLYELKNNVEVILGGLIGRYVSKGPFEEEKKSSHISLMASQSFYGSNTQLLDSSLAQSTDIHDAPTQEISWAFVKPKRILANKPPRDSPIITDSNDAILQGGIPPLSEEFNDENLPLLEDTENFQETNRDVAKNKETCIDEESTEVIEHKKSPEKSNLEDDEATDCEDDGNIKLGGEKINTLSTKSDKPVILKDDITECPKASLSDDSSDSMEFLRAERPFNSNVPESSIAHSVDAGASKLNSDSDREEDFAGQRTKKSFMVISTQDIVDESPNPVKRQSEIDTSQIEDRAPQLQISYDDSYLKIERELRASSNFDNTIPPTQDRSLGEFNDSDFIPATQEVNKFLINESQNRNKNAGSSEESFKLGLTELMTESSQGVKETQKVLLGGKAKLSSFEENVDIYEAPTQRVLTKNDDEIDCVPTFATDDIFLAPTQKLSSDSLPILGNKTSKLIGSTEESTEIYDAPTQKININSDEGIDVLHTELENSYNRSVSETEYIFCVPTQKIHNLNADEGSPETLADQPREVSVKLFEDNKDPKKKFSFRKNNCNLDASLSILADNKTVESNMDENIAATSESEKNIADSVNDKVPAEISDTNTKEHLDLEKSDDVQNHNKQDETETTFNATKNDVNMSVTILESKIIKTKKCRRTVDIHVSVPRTRRTMSISKDGEPSEPSSPVNMPRRETAITSNLDDDSSTSGNRRVSQRSTRQSKPASLTERELPGKNKQTINASRKNKPEIHIPEKNKISDVHSKTCSNSRHERVNDSKKQTVSYPETSKKPSRRNPKVPHSVNNNVIEVNQSSNGDQASTSFHNTTKAKRKNASSESDGGGRVNDSKKQTVSYPETSKKPSRRNPKVAHSVNNNVIEVNQSNDGDQASTSFHNTTKAKRKNASSESDGGGLAIAATPPKKRKIQLAEISPNTEQRGLRKQRPKVVFTMMENPQLECLIKQLGGSVVQSVESCTVLVTEQVKRSQKLLSAIGLGKPICSPRWITDSKKAQHFLDPWDYILTDPEAEKKWKFSLKESLNRSKADKVLNSCSFYIQVTNGADVLKGAIEACGGKCLSKIPAAPLEDAYIVSSADNRSKYNRITKKYPNFTVIEAEAIFDGVLRQELGFSKHILD